METALALLTGLFIAAAIYLIMSRALIRMVIGIVVLGNGVNLLIFTAGRLTRALPPIVPVGMVAPATAYANPLPQALILTAIVIGFALFAFLVVLAWRAYQAMDADNTDTMRLAEPPDAPPPPMDY
ncbi:MAG: Na+/H+ antiporter subunit C [Devosia sp.]